MKERSPRVLLALDWHDPRLLQGIEQFADVRGWQLHGSCTQERIIPWGWDGDGILSWLNAGGEWADFVAQAGKPTVDFSSRRTRKKVTRVVEDNVGAARLVAAHFLSKGIRQFLFYSDTRKWVQLERGHSFRQTLVSAGCKLRWLSWADSPAFRADRSAWQVRRHWLTSEIQRAIKPLGVFAATDGLACEAFESCVAAGVRVPEEVAIVGMGNTLLAVDAMTTPISSVDTNLEALGYCGAEQLHRLMRGLPSPVSPIRVASRLVIRKSSDSIAVANPGIARSLRFLRQHHHQSIGVGDLARVADMSLRSFHDAFTRHLGRTPGAEIRQFRLEKAKRLLTSSNLKLDTIATECGYPGGRSLCSAFKLATGVSPFRFRRQRNGAETGVNGSS